MTRSRRTFLGFCLASAGTNLLARKAQPLLSQFEFESKLWPNLHHFLYVLARARNGVPDRTRVAVRQAPLDTAGFDALPVAQRKAWDEAIAVYQAHAATEDIEYGKLVTVNYAVADLAPSQRIEEAKEIPADLSDALAKAAPVYRALWWPRHDAANRAWIRQLSPQVARYGPQIVQRITSAVRHLWPRSPLLVEVVAYANWAGAYTTSCPPLIAMSSLNEEHRGSDGLEELFHECTHLIMDTVDASLKAHAESAGKTVSRDVSHAILFYTVGEAVRGAVPGHVPYGMHYGVWDRFGHGYLDLLKLHWQPYLDGKSTMEEAIERLVRAL